MKNNYNPYTVPEDFFETTCDRAVAKYRGRKRAVRLGIAAMAVAALTLIIPILINNSNEERQLETTIASGNLADLYEYDIFLQVNFTE